MIWCCAEVAHGCVWVCAAAYNLQFFAGLWLCHSLLRLSHCFSCAGSRVFLFVCGLFVAAILDVLGVVF